jgi:thiol-disulfide isomerase/thioredoxin
VIDVEALQGSIECIEQVAPADGATPSADYLNRVGAKVRALTMQRKSDEAAKLAGDLLAMSRKQYEATPDESGALMALLDALTIASQTASDPKASNSLQLEAEALVTSALEKTPENPMLVQRFASTAMGRLSTLARSDAEAAAEALEALRAKFSELGEGNANVAQMLSRYARSLDSIERSIQSQLKLAKLVGSEAPAIDAAYWVNGKGMSADDLKGKVVLLDFWAVWCGPCIATFPHLREWNEEYGDKGLQIVGVTRKYNYEWNEQAQRAERIEGEHSDEDEIAMLEQFLAHHELGHPTIVTPQNSNMQGEYAVSGIPHAVLIDRKGVIRMVKVGSGEANAKALHDKIEELLAE